MHNRHLARNVDSVAMPEKNGTTTRDGQNVTIVHDLLRQKILRGGIPIGETSQAALARELDVGRTPLREAIRMLQREGLVISEPNRRLRIAELVAGRQRLGLAEPELIFVEQIAAAVHPQIRIAKEDGRIRHAIWPHCLKFRCALVDLGRRAP